jgi:hypothetical protein
MDKQHWREKTNRKLVNFNTLEHILETFPKAFVEIREGEPKPLMIGIGLKIRKFFKAQKVDWKYDINGALSIYCKSPEYQKAMLKAGNQRVNLEGEPIGEILESHAFHHRVNLINKQRLGYLEGYKQCMNDLTKLMGRFATGKNFTRSCDAAEAHVEKLAGWAEGKGDDVPSLFEEDSLANRLKALREVDAAKEPAPAPPAPEPAPKRPVLKLSVKSNRVMIKRKAS